MTVHDTRSFSVNKFILSRVVYPPFLLFLSILLLATGCESRRTIVNNLDEREANEILVFLANRGIDANKVQSKEAGGAGSKIVLWDISVSGSQATEAMALLNTHGLPRRRGQNLLGIFSKGGLVPSELEEKIKYQAGLAEQIASTIRKIDGVLDAEVVLSLPQEESLFPGAEKKPKATASVYVKHTGVLDDPNSHLITRIKRLVASSVPGLDYDNVTVISDRARYNEVPPEHLKAASEKNFVRLWTVVVADESVSRFRLIFFSFFGLVVLSLGALGWILWKCFPIIEKSGGMKKLLSLQPLELSEKTEGEQEEEEAGEEEKKIEKKKK
jgi:type III secretion protein J